MLDAEVKSEAADETSPAPAESVSAAPIQARLWPAVVLMALFWTFVASVEWIEMTMFLRFVSRMIAYGLFLLLFLGWWLSNRRIAWRDRLLAVVVMIAGCVLASLVSHDSVKGFPLFMTGIPIVLTVWTGWLLATRNRPLHLQRAGFVALIGLTWGYYGLVRWDGLDGAQHTKLSWRWTPTAEEEFLARRDSSDTKRPVTASSVSSEWNVQPGDWLEFRGPHRASKVAGVRLADWKTDPPKLLWRQRVGPAWSSVLIVDGRLVTQEQRGESEVVVCYDAASGKELWVHQDSERFSEPLSGTGPRATPTFDNGRIYTLGARGKLNCIEAVSGKALWSRDIAADAKASVPQWGYSCSPAVVDNAVIVFAGGEGERTLWAYHVETGEPVWSIAAGKNSYSSPQFVTFDEGERHLLMDTDRGLLGIAPRSGAVLWERPYSNAMALPTLQPQLVGPGQLLVQSDTGVTLLGIAKKEGKWTTAELWTSTRLKPSFNDFVVYEGHVYGFDDGIFCCVDLKTGNRRWKKGRYGHGQALLLVDQGIVFVLCESGEAVLVRATADRSEELGRFRAIEGKCWNHPVIAHGRLYVRNEQEMACYELKLEGKTSVATNEK